MSSHSGSPTKRKQNIDEENLEFYILENKIQCRDREIQILRSLIGEPHHLTFSSIFIYGHASTGKSYVLKSLLDNCKVPYVWMNCIVMYSQRLLFEAVLNSFSNMKMSNQTSSFTVSVSCDSTCDFVYQLKQSLKDHKSDGPTAYLVFDKADKLCNMPPTTLATIMRLQELTGLNLCVIFVSDNSWDKFHFGTHFPEPYILHFPQYSNEQLLRILQLDCPEGYSQSFYADYLQLVLNLCLLVTRNLQELRYIALSNFKKYCEPLDTNETTEENKHKLWKSAAPHLKNALSTVYLRESSGISGGTKELSEDGKSESLVSNRANVELPFFSKFLLLASYIASYNLPKADKQMFIKNSGRIRKKSVHKIKKRIVAQHERGPKAFPLHRMLAIFYSIIEEEPKPSTYLMSQISSLVSLRLLFPVGNDLNFPKYKCIVTLEFIRSISRTVSFDIMSYLSDFL